MGGCRKTFYTHSNKIPTNTASRTATYRNVLLSLVLTLLNSLPALAGQWQVSASAQGTNSYTLDAAAISWGWGNPPFVVAPSLSWSASQSNDVVNPVVNGVPFVSLNDIYDPADPWRAGFSSASASGTVTYTFTWGPDKLGFTGPAPAKVALVEQTFSYYITANSFPISYIPLCSASDGKGDACQVVYQDRYGITTVGESFPSPSNILPGSLVSPYNQVYGNQPPSDPTVVVVDGSSGKIVRQFTMSATAQADSISGSCGVGCYCDCRIVPLLNAPSINLGTTSDSENDLFYNLVSGPSAQVGYGSYVANLGQPITYNVYRSADPSLPMPWTLIGTSSPVPGRPGSSPFRTYQDTGLQPNTQYSYYMTAVDKYGQESSPSNIVTSTTDSMTVIAEIESTGDSSAAGGGSTSALVSGVSAQAEAPVLLEKYKYFLSGTDATIHSEAAISGTGPLRIIEIVQKVNGKVTNSRTYAGGVTFASIDSKIDSTHYPNGSAVTTETISYSNRGDSKTARRTKLAYNQAAVYGNVKGFSDNPGPIETSFINVSDIIKTKYKMNHLVTSSTSDDKLTILHGLFSHTVLYIATHAGGVPYVQFSDCSNADGDAGKLFATYDPTGAASISTAVGWKKIQRKPIPAYNFVFIDGCASGAFPDFAYAFDVNDARYTLADQAFLGWNVNVLNTMKLAAWTTLLWNSLASGDTLEEARHISNEKYPLGVNLRKQLQIPVVSGDRFMKLHGVYQGNGLSYFKALP